MALNVISNYAANVAHRNLSASDAAATSSLAKLSAGSRVIGAKDDAAALAIGSRLSVEVSALKQASVNAGQAVSMLQIADGAMGKVQDIMTRMKTLAVQAGSGQLSETERSMLDTEYQSLLSEVDRIAEDTEFNGNQLVNGSITVSGGAAALGQDDGVVTLSVNAVADGTNPGGLAYATGAGGGTFTLTATDAATGTTESYTGTISSDAYDATSGLLNTGTAIKLTSTDAEADGFMTITLNTSFDAKTAVSVSSSDSMDFTTSGTSSYDFKIGSGTSDSDVISVTVDGINTDTLGIAGTDIASATNADAASAALSLAVDTLNTTRANVGASQNRLEFASANLATATENAEAARSDLLDLDIASEMTVFTSKQILVQAGVSMLAQANQMPQNLLRLFQ
jgi:flagellin